jgi:hypothetical protein
MERPDNTVRFLRQAAAELRRLAQRAPEIADELQSMARQLEAKPTIWPPTPTPNPEPAQQSPAA